jgi:hypothetical protein
VIRLAVLATVVQPTQEENMSVTPSPSKLDENSTDCFGGKNQSKNGFSSGYNRDDPPKGLDFDKLSPDERHHALDS